MTASYIGAAVIVKLGESQIENKGRALPRPLLPSRSITALS